MKRVLFSTLALLLAGILAMAQSNNKKDELVFNNTMHDYGSMVYGADGSYDFVFTNTSKKTIALTDVKSSCGCTVPSWSKEPIKPGQTGVVKVVYNTKIPGTFNKTVTVYSTAKNSPVRLIIMGKVNAQPSDLKPSYKKTGVNPKIMQRMDQEEMQAGQNNGKTSGVIFIKKSGKAVKLPPGKTINDIRRANYEKKFHQKAKTVNTKTTVKKGGGF